MFQTSITLQADAYFTIQDTSSAIFRDRGSKFIAYAIPVSKESEVGEQIRRIKDDHPKSRHICYAYRIGQDGQLFRLNDDGEPKGSAGRPIYQAIQSSGYLDILVAVARYFGGTKLGLPGLINAYKTSAKESLGHCIPREIILTDDVLIHFEMKNLGSLYNILKDSGVKSIETDYSELPSMKIAVRKSKTNLLIHEIRARYHGLDPKEVDMDFVSDKILLKVLT